MEVLVRLDTSRNDIVETVIPDDEYTGDSEILGTVVGLLITFAAVLFLGMYIGFYDHGTIERLLK